MQRINLFPDPNMANTIFQCIPVQCTVDFPTVSGFRWLRATTSGSGGYAQYQLTGANLPPAGVYHIHAVCYAQGSGALFRVYAGDGNRYTILHETGIADNQTKTIDADITIPANTKQLLIRVVPPSTVGKFILIRDILLESKSTYDTAIGGGASELLHGEYDAARIGASVGRVMSDDGDEPDKQSKTQRHAEAGRVHADFDHRKADWRRILVHGLAGRVGRLHHDNQLSRHLQQESTHRMGLHVHVIESDEPGIQCRVRQSDRQGAGHGPVRAGRIPGEQDPARQHRIFHRGHDAARLTLTGVVA